MSCRQRWVEWSRVVSRLRRRTKSSPNSDGLGRDTSLLFTFNPIKTKKNRKSLEYYRKDLLKIEELLKKAPVKHRELEVELLVTEFDSGLEINYAPQTRTILMAEIEKPKMPIIGQKFGPFKYQSFPISSVETY